MTELPTGTVTFLFTDLERSTRLWEEQRDAMRVALARHDELLKRAVEAQGGQVVKGTGDGLHVVFGTAESAVAAALACQVALSDESWGATGPLRVRMGLHTGTAEQRGGDYFGPVLNRAARLMGVAHPGQVLCSQATADLVRDSLAPSVALVDLGEHRLRDLSRPERVFQVTHPKLGAEFPPLLSLDAYPTNLPAERTTLVGRQRLLVEVAAALESVRVITLTGVGGVGKTRLARQVAADVLPRFRDGAWLVELAPVVDPGAVVEVVASALGVTQRQGLTLSASVIDFLRAKRLLLVLDNCEHLLDAVARFADEVIDSCPRVSVVATSREALSVVGERVVGVPSLELPNEADAAEQTLAQTEAVRLFIERAVEAKPDFRMSEGNTVEVVRLCRRLDGIPLAIELAAARVRSLTPAELADRLDARFQLLAGGPRTAVERHQTLRRAIDWSYDLLSEPERWALDRVAVFAGGFGVDAAEQVITIEGLEPAEVVDALAHLVDKSLLLAEDHDGVTRYQLLETIRQYAQDRLEADGDADRVRGCHAEFYAGFATEAGQGLRGPHEAVWTRRVEVELDNLRAALAWSLAADDVDLALRLVAPFGAVHTTRAGYSASPWVEPVLTLADAATHPLYPQVLAWSGWIAMSAGDVERGIRVTHQALEATATSSTQPSRCQVLRPAIGTLGMTGRGEEAGYLAAEFLALARSLGDDHLIANALTASATPFFMAGDIDQALVPLEQALALARRLGNPSDLAAAATMAGMVLLDTQPERARELLDEALEAATSVDNPLSIGMAVAASAHIELDQGDWREATRRWLRAIDHCQRIGDTFTARNMLGGLANTLATAGADETAAVFSGAPTTTGPAGNTPFDARSREAEARLRQRLGDARFDACAARGATMDTDELVALAHQELNRLANSPSPAGSAAEAAPSPAATAEVDPSLPRA
jgi:predicted ATPase/class 3 adenylate cyclase